MIRPPLKTVRVESKFFPGGVLINAGDFNPDTNKLVSDPDQDPDLDPDLVTDKTTAPNKPPVK